MPLDVPVLDDRRFDDLVAECRRRLAAHVPEWAGPSPGDPVDAMVDVMAFLAETVIYRANLIPERQRRAFLNLLRLPLRAASPARGVLCIDALPERTLPPALASGTALAAGAVRLSTAGELQPLPLSAVVVLKRRTDADTLAASGISAAQLEESYGGAVTAFTAHAPILGHDPIELGTAVDHSAWIALLLPPRAGMAPLTARRLLAGRGINLGVATRDEVPASSGDAGAVESGAAERTRSPRQLAVDLIIADPDAPAAATPEQRHATIPLALERIADSSEGARRPGVLRLRLPNDLGTLPPPLQEDPQYIGFGDSPPELPSAADAARVVAWLRLRSPDEPTLALAWLGINAVEVVAQEERRDELLGSGTGESDQVVRLRLGDVDPASLRLEVQELAGYAAWQLVEGFSGSRSDHRHAVLDPKEGLVRFGDGVRGLRPGAGARIRAARYRAGGGALGNLPAGTVKDLVAGGRYTVRHEWALSGGTDGESVDAAERRLSSWLSHRDRAVTADDFRALALACPTAAVERAEPRPGFVPVPTLALARRDVPGAVAVFVLPPGEPALAAAPRATASMLREVFDHLASRRTIGTELYVLSPAWRRLAVGMTVSLLDETARERVTAAVQAAVTRWLWALPPGGPNGGGWPLGRRVDGEEIEAVAARVDGILAVDQVRLFTPVAGRWQPLANGRIELADYELPELAAVAVTLGTGEPPAPGAPPVEGPKPVPAPVIPAQCCPSGGARG